MNPREYFIVNEGEGVFVVRILEVHSDKVIVEQLCVANPRSEVGWLKDPQPREFSTAQIKSTYWSLYARPEDLVEVSVYEI